MTKIVEKDRNRKVVEIVKLFLRSVVFYRKLYTDYREGSLKFSSVQELVDDKGQSLLFNLKKNCQALYRGNDNSTEREKLFDLAVGSIFHEAMIIRENCYQLEVYRPRVALIKEKAPKTPLERKFLREVDLILNRAKKRLSEELKETDTLITNTLEQLKGLLLSYKENGLLVRFLLEEEGLVEEAFGKGSLDDLLSHMYGGGRLEALIAAAKSYYQSGYYDKARDAVAKALAIRTSDNIRFLFLLYSGMNDYYEGNSQAALEHLREAKALAENLTVDDEALKRIDSITSRILEPQQQGR